MAKRKGRKRGTTKIGIASHRCPTRDPKTGRRIRTKAERSSCMKAVMKGGKSGRKKKRR